MVPKTAPILIIIEDTFMPKKLINVTDQNKEKIVTNIKILSSTNFGSMQYANVAAINDIIVGYQQIL